MPTLPPIRAPFSFLQRMAWSTLSKALAKSRYIVSMALPDSRTLVMVSTWLSNWERVDLPWRKPCWFIGSKLFSCRCLTIAALTIFSKILIKWEVREIGLYDLGR